MKTLGMKYSSGHIIKVSDIVGYDPLDGGKVARIGRIVLLIQPNSAESLAYGCDDTGGVLIEFSGNESELWTKVDEHLVLLNRVSN
jgi:hypothetical protein